MLTMMKFWFVTIKGFGIYGGGVKFWVLPLKWLVTLTTVLRYRAVCDHTSHDSVSVVRTTFKVYICKKNLPVYN